jgi:hypothetical protein
MKTLSRIAIVAAAAALIFTDFDFTTTTGLPAVSLTAPAEARVGRPATPVSYAGVARRTTRRVVRTNYRVNALPPGCHYGPYYGGNYWNCAGVYYEQSGNVYIQVTVE